MTAVRDASAGDMATLVRLVEDHFAGTIPFEIDASIYGSMFAGQRLDGEYLRVADRDGKAVGFLSGKIARLVPWSWEHCALELIMALEPHEKSGFAMVALIRDFERWARAQDCRLVRLTSQTAVEGERVGRLFALLGYRPVETSHMKRLD